jgi:hypothetical protein
MHENGANRIVKNAALDISELKMKMGQKYTKNMH